MINLQENSIDDETAVVLPNIITDAIEQINLNGCNVSKQGLIKIATKISELKNPVSIFASKKMYKIDMYQ